MTDTTAEDRLLLTEDQAADLIGLTSRFLQARRHRGNGPPFVRISSRCVRYRPEDLREWIADRVKTSTAEK